jgi:glutamate-1-semialdehyde 2,1-aminomutase
VPDIVCLAKALGGGVPCGAIGGTAEVMDAVTTGTYEQVGTFNGNPLTMAAARATLLEVLTPAAYAHFDDLREELASRARRCLDRHHLPGYVSAFGAKGSVVFSPTPICDYRDFCRGRSVNLPRSRPACWRERGKLAVPPRVTPAG